MAPTLRAKMQVERVIHDLNPDGTTSQETVTLRAVYNDSPENKEFSKWTPAAQFTITISNPTAFGKLSRGHEFYVDFTPVS